MNDTNKVKDEATKLHFLDYINFEFDGTMFTFPMEQIVSCLQNFHGFQNL